MKRRLMQCLSGMALIAAAASAFADDGFTITRFEVEGNSLLPADEVQRLLQPMSGPHRVYGDIQHALEALENAYRKAGYTAVQVYVPEQELTSGVVRLQVTENRIGKITVTGNQHFSKKERPRRAAATSERPVAEPARNLRVGAIEQRQTGQAGRRNTGE